MDKKTISKMFSDGITRKKDEINILGMRALENPSKCKYYSDLTDFITLDLRYYQLAYAYYSDEIDILDDGNNEDLLLLTSENIPPRLYAMYLREIDPASRTEEKTTKKILDSLKNSIRTLLESV